MHSKDLNSRFLRLKYLSSFHIIGPASGVLYELKKQNPDKTFYTLTENQICTDMKLITPEKVLQVLKEEINEVKVPEKVRIQAGAPLEKMLMLAR